VLRDDCFWDGLRRRTASRSEPQLRPAAVDRVREGLPAFLVGLNAVLAVKAAERAAAAAVRASGRAIATSGRDADSARAAERASQKEGEWAAEAARHRRLVASWPVEPATAARALRDALRPVRQQLQGLCQGVEALGPTDYVHPSLENAQIALELFRRVLPLPLHDTDRDNLRRDVEPALYKLCWFCQRRVADPARASQVWLHGRVTRKTTGVEWYYRLESVPRCWHCFNYHRGADLPAGVRPEADRDTFPDLRQCLAEGWVVGKRPSNL
jgi:hypothetical protein